jgi:hypothetical protein
MAFGPDRRGPKAAKAFPGRTAVENSRACQCRPHVGLRRRQGRSRGQVTYLHAFTFRWHAIEIRTTLYDASDIQCAPRGCTHMLTLDGAGPVQIAHSAARRAGAPCQWSRLVSGVSADGFAGGPGGLVVTGGATAGRREFWVIPLGPARRFIGRLDGPPSPARPERPIVIRLAALPVSQSACVRPSGTARGSSHRGDSSRIPGGSRQRPTMGSPGLAARGTTSCRA